MPLSPHLRRSLLGLSLLASLAHAQAPQEPQAHFESPALTPQQLVTQTVANERAAAAEHDRYAYTSTERSDRTGGHLWTERIVEIAAGRVRLLTAIDGQPLTAAQQQQERAKLDAILADPTAFLRTEQANKAEEARARRMLDLLPQGFLFDNVRLAEGLWRLDFHPNPAFTPSGIEDRVLGSMSGYVVIDAAQKRLLHIEGHLPQDISIGFGLLASVKAGSHFLSDRRDLNGHWRTVHVITDIRGKAVLFKTVSRSSEITRSGFHYLDPNETLPQAIALLEQ